jgi:hypothetical protein
MPVYRELLCENYVNREDSWKTLPRSHRDTEIKNSVTPCLPGLSAKTGSGERFWLRLEVAL